jgi:nucleoside-diphosphate-sugar epimerase
VPRELHRGIGRVVPNGTLTEASPWQSDRNTSPYSISKYEAELQVQRGIAEGLAAVVVNPSIVLGPGPAGRSSMTMVERIRKGTRYYPSGANAVVDARDVARPWWN